jgi:hypothetical protein
VFIHSWILHHILFSDAAQFNIPAPIPSEQLVWSENLLIEHFILHLTADNYLHFLMIKLPFLMVNVPLETKLGCSFSMNGHLQIIVTVFLHQQYRNQWIGHNWSSSLVIEIF